MRIPYKRQHTDKYSAEKINSKKKLGAVSRVDSHDNEKTRLSFPSEFSLVGGAKKNNRDDSGSGMQQPISFRRSGTQRERDRKPGRSNRHRITLKNSKSPALSSAQGADRNLTPGKSNSTDSRHRLLGHFMPLPNKGQMRMHR